MIKVLIAGLGSIGRRHLRNLLSLGDSEIFLYRTHRSTLPDDELEGFPVDHDLQAALRRGPQAVIVSNPTALHLEVAIPAAQAGCHLLLEKPVSHSKEGLDRLQAAAQHSGSQVLVGYQFRFHPGLIQLKQLLEQAAVGRVLSVRAHWGEYLPAWHPWEDYRQSYSSSAELGGGVILTLSHPLDYLRWLFGEVERLWAFAGQLNELEMNVEDTAEIGLQFKSGAIGSLHLDYNQRPPAHKLEVIGSRGSLRWDNSDGAVHLYQASQPPQLDSSTLTWSTLPASQDERPLARNDLFVAEMSHFLEVARGQAQPVCSLEDGVRALELALGALQSAQERRLIDFNH
jgi:predicted dehydrogenase